MKKAFQQALNFVNQEYVEMSIRSPLPKLLARRGGTTDGMFLSYNNSILVYAKRGNDRQITAEYIGTIVHEMTHALDHKLGADRESIAHYAGHQAYKNYLQHTTKRPGKTQ